QRGRGTKGKRDREKEAKTYGIRLFSVPCSLFLNPVLSLVLRPRASAPIPIPIPVPIPVTIMVMLVPPLPVLPLFLFAAVPVLLMLAACFALPLTVVHRLLIGCVVPMIVGIVIVARVRLASGESGRGHHT